jgi:sortase A
MPGPAARRSATTETAPRRLAASLAVERLAWTVGVVALAAWGILTITGGIGTRREIHRFNDLRARVSLAAPDQQLWSPQRVRAWQESIAREAPEPLAVLRIRRVGLEVAVLDGTDDWTLNRAVGYIEDTARPGADGNTGIAGHRDGFFRVLKDVVPGDTIELEMPEGAVTYHVERAWIVEPDDVSVLDPTPTRAITLVTCYPFYYIGSAPQRYIIRAVRDEPLLSTRR